MSEARYEWVNASKNVQNEHPLIKTPEHMVLGQILPEEFPTPPDRPTAIVFEAMFLCSPQVEPGMMPTSNEKEQKGISDLSIRLK